MADIRKCAGLFTFFSELEEPVGALSTADNVVIDQDDIISPRRGLKEYGTALSPDSTRLKQLMQYRDRILRHYGSTLQYDNGSGTFASFNGSYSELETGLRMKYQEVNGNLYFTTTDGIKKISATSASEFATTSNYITSAGGPKALDVNGLLKVSSSGFLTAQSKVAYRVVWGYRDLNSYLVLGSPSSRLVVQNNTENVKSSTLTVSANPLTGGQYFLIDLNDGTDTTKYFVWFDVSGTEVEPKQADTINRTGIKVSLNGSASLSADASRIANAISDTISSSELTISVNAGVITFSMVSPLSTITLTAGAAGTTNHAVRNITVATTQSANVELTFSVPSGITTDYFYQIYRSPVVQISGTQTLDDIDPGEELQLIDENFYVSGTSITITDITPESFRETGAPLYTNPNSGQGILQSNERPPVAKDLALFRGSQFYSNTKTIHRKQFSLLSVSDFVSGTSAIVIGNSTAARTYTFRGAAEVFTITTDSRTNTTGTGYILLNSASNERKYYLWFDKTGSATDPAVSERIGIRVDISVAADTAAGTSAAIASAFTNISDFTVTDGTGTNVITCVKNGNVTDASIGSALGGAWAVAAPSTQGDGEDTSINEVLLSSLSSVGQAIDETARSLVKVINSDTSGIVYAFYLSGAEDLPGMILLESRNLTDTTFYCGVSVTAMTDNFSPDFPLIKTVTGINATGDVITLASHGLSVGNKIYFYGSDCTPALLGEYTVATTPTVNTFTLTGTAITVNGTTGKFFLTSVKSDNETFGNRLYFSKTNQPEAVPILNYLEIGPRNKEIKRIIALRDNLFVLKEDGVYIVTGSSATNANLSSGSGFTYRLLSNSTQILGPDTAQVLNNQIFMLSNQGVVSISESGGDEIKSRQIENLISSIANARYTNYKTIAFGVSYENDRAYTLWLPTETDDTVATQGYRYNVLTKTWTRLVKSVTCGLVYTTDDKLYLGSGDSEYLLQERKNGNRTDFADIEVSLTLPPSAIDNGTTFELSSVSEVDDGDVLTQTQYITLSRFNRLLRKLDLDPGPSADNFESTLLMVAGDNIQTKMVALDVKLQAAVTGYTTTAFASSDFATIQTNYNTLIGKLNDAAVTGTLFKNYETSSGTTTFEVLITERNNTNRVTVNLASSFIEGPITLYKGYTQTIVWQPQHFDNVSAYKQIREGSVLFDQNNFHSANVYYSTDVSQNFERIPITGQGVGTWGEFSFGNIDFGGGGADIPARNWIPRNKQRCRYITVKFDHKNARESFKILGITLEPRNIGSSKAYR